MFYFEQRLSNYLKERGYKNALVDKDIVEVGDDRKLVIKVRYDYTTASGSVLTDSKTLWSSREMTGDDEENCDALGKLDPEECLIHFGILMKKGTSKEDLAVLAGLDDPKDFANPDKMDKLSDKGLADVLAAMKTRKGLPRDWKVTSISDGVTVCTPSGDHFSFDA